METLGPINLAVLYYNRQASHCLYTPNPTTSPILVPGLVSSTGGSLLGGSSEGGRVESGRDEVDRDSSGGFMSAFFRLRLAFLTSCLKFSLFLER